MEKNVIENLLWTDIFPKDILSFSLPIVVVIFLLRIIANCEKCRQVKAFVFLIKALAYGYLVVLLGIYFYKGNAIQNINIFTGFTFLFSAVEVVDNIMLGFEEVRSNMHLPKDFWKKQLVKEEDNFESMISSLKDLHKSIQPGSVNELTEKYLKEVLDKKKTMSFYNIDSILQNRLKQKYCFTNALSEIMCSKMILDIIGYEKSKSIKEVKTPSFSNQQCEEFKEVLNKVMSYKGIYYEEKQRISLEKKNMDLV